LVAGDARNPDAAAPDAAGGGQVDAAGGGADGATGNSDGGGAFADARDTTPPTVTITNRATNCANEPFTFSADEPATFTCTLDTTVVSDCMSPFALDPNTITDGPHTFSVSAVDRAGNVSLPVPPIMFTIDKTGPVVTVDGITKPADSMGFYDPNGIITFHSDGSATAYACQLDGMAPVDCTPASGDTGTFAYSGLTTAGNPHTFSVGAIDSCMNPSSTPGTLMFNVDSVGPVLCVVMLTTDQGIPSQVTCTSGTPSGVKGTITFTSDSGGTYFCGVDAPAPTTPCMPGVPFQYGPLTGGGHHFYVVGTDTHGNPGMLTFDWTVDATGPQMTIDNVATPPNTGSAVIDYHANEPLKTQSCSVDGAACQSCTHTQAICEGLSVGPHTFSVTGTDVFNNKGFPTTQMFSITYGPNEGHAIVIGHDLPDANDPAFVNETALLVAAIEQVPWLHEGPNQTSLFDRPIQLAAFRGPMTSNTEVTNALGAINSLIDTSFYTDHEFSDPNDLDTALLGADVLLIYDQQDPAGTNTYPSSFQIGVMWHDALETYLDAGGIVVLLDGYTTYPLILHNYSETFNILAAYENCETLDVRQIVCGFPPLVDISDPIRYPNENNLDCNLGAVRMDDFNDALPPHDYSPLAVMQDGYTPPVNATVEYQRGDRTARYVYAQDCGGDDITGISPPYADIYYPIVIDKIFPWYRFTTGYFYRQSVDPNDPFPLIARNQDQSPLVYDHIDCHVAQLECNQGQIVGNDCQGCDADAFDTSACPCPGTGTAGPLRMAFKAAGTYEIDLRVIDPYGRPGQHAYQTVTIDPPSISVTTLPTDGTCSTNIQLTAHTVGCVSVAVTAGDGGDTITPAGPTASCVGNDRSMDTTYTITATKNNQLGCDQRMITITATDAYNNFSTTTVNWTPQCQSCATPDAGPPDAAP
jgi:hypothetical protein